MKCEESHTETPPAGFAGRIPTPYRNGVAVLVVSGSSESPTPEFSQRYSTAQIIAFLVLNGPPFTADLVSRSGSSMSSFKGIRQAC